MKIHEDQQVYTAGEPLKKANKAVVMLHGRGATAQGILELQQNLPNAAYLAPQAKNHKWYLNPFMKSVEQNQPHLDSALQKINSIIEKITEYMDKSKVGLLGFSQGACLASEYTARNPTMYGGVIGFSGGLIGETLREYIGDMQKTPVFLGCAENDPHIPLKRVNETEQIFETLNADVEKYIFEGSQHGITDHEIKKAREIINQI